MTGGWFNRRFRPAFTALMLCALVPPLFGQTETDDPEERVIHYFAPGGLDDPVARLQQRLARGETTLRFEPRRGYLRSLLQELRVPVSSQGLVYSKTSSQAAQTSPRTPRAIYFTDDVYVGWVPDGPEIDLAAMDPKRGSIFYTLDQRREGPPTIVRRDDCLKCHLGPRTANVPGLLVRSILTAADGTPLSQIERFVSGHNSPLETRWGGWYVTGTHVGAQHLGNILVTDPVHPEHVNPAEGANVTRLKDKFDTARYLSPHSDLVALMVLEHELRMQNLIIRANYETLLARDPQSGGGGTSGWPEQRIARAGETLLEYLLFRNEAPLKGPVKGSSKFAAEFQRGGPRARDGRSLRRLDLQTRMFRHPCSFLIYSRAFDGLPREMKNYLWRRLVEILSGEDQSETYAGMEPRDRRAVLEILRETKPEFAAAERAGSRSRAATDAPALNPP